MRRRRNARRTARRYPLGMVWRLFFDKKKQKLDRDGWQYFRLIMPRYLRSVKLNRQKHSSAGVNPWLLGKTVAVSGSR